MSCGETSDVTMAPLPKKTRYLDNWEAALSKQNEKKKTLGLSDLFGARTSNRSSESIDNSVSEVGHQERAFRERSDDSSFFTLRLEHREGGVAARHQQEERILLFRSDKPGAIAKIIYSSTPAPEDSGTRSSASSGDDEETELRRMAQAKIHVLNVKEAYRGFDLGSLLFSEALASLRHRYMDQPEDDEEDTDDDDSSEYVYHPSSICCTLDAEEDIRRHNKLIGFYEGLGCRVKPKAKVQYINNNDGETYRKVPMQIALQAHHEENHGRRRKAQDAGSLIGRQGGFLPVHIFESPGKRVGLPRGEKVDWLLIDDGSGCVELRTTKGHSLRLTPEGSVDIKSDDDFSGDEGETLVADNWCKFYLLRVSDATQEVNEQEDDESLPEEVRSKELWLLQSSHGTFLALDRDSHFFRGSVSPAFWQIDRSAFSLMCTSDTPPRRLHYRKLWMKQTVEYVTAMKQRYLSFSLKRMELRTALDLVKSLPAYHFEIEAKGHTPSMRTRCFRTAEVFRNAGHPDWVQLLALVYSLGGVANLIDAEAAISSEDDYDWTIPSRARVIGCSAPSSVVFSEFRSLNADENDSRYNSQQGMYEMHCGLDNVLLTWTGPEYMHHMLKQNKIDVPEEGLKMFRYASLSDWHTKGQYMQFANDDDLDVQSFAADFDELLRTAKDEARFAKELTAEECDTLWNTHYADIATKYNADGLLMW